ncbi:pyridoxamine 5'-phosphate oxidase family protein [Couchioplanes azureus]|uniref:pyridoxamine 5'-phosphate oxidase family protein n=1 Tax=Couchioplanes caeruleus TaxID=56438 RepID=UPI00167179A1|nr:pyridoxamine 5'-phosphate oxidase family protein [Couchioplanes caeruleus]GGQ86287.1 hypothetical protein GCM10010166_65610 [Couchioplanes caeruleus subsp. azureus]
MHPDISDRVAAFLDEVMPIVVGTKRKNGVVKMDPAWYEFRDGHFWLNSWRGSRWLAAIERDKQASLLLMDPKDMTRVVHVETTLVMTTEEGAPAHFDRLNERYQVVGHDDPEPQTRVIIQLEPTDVRSTLDWVAQCAQ